MQQINNKVIINKDIINKDMPNKDILNKDMPDKNNKDIINQNNKDIQNQNNKDMPNKANKDIEINQHASITQSINGFSLQERDKDTIAFRTNFAQNLLKGGILKPLINFNNIEDTEIFKYGNHGNKTKDTRYLLDKRVYDFNNVINNIGGKLYYIKSGSTGHTFKSIIESQDGGEPLTYAVKVVAYPKKNKYNYIYDSERPENAEIMMIRLLSYFIVNKQTPHIVLPIATFNTSIQPFLKLMDENVIDNSDKKYVEFLDNYKEGMFHDEVSILISEWANRGDLLDYIRKNYMKFQLIHWKVFFFQIISTLAVIQSKFPSFRHNDMKANNILIHKISRDKPKFNYRVLRKNYSIPNIGYSIKLWDFDFACIPNVVNNIKVSLDWTKPINVTPVKNTYYDIHYFFNTLVFTGFFPKFMTSDTVPDQVKEFVCRVVPEKYRTVVCIHNNEKNDKQDKKEKPEKKPEKKSKKKCKPNKEELDNEKPICDCHKLVHERGRLLENNEFITPGELLNDVFFKEFLVE